MVALLVVLGLGGSSAAGQLLSADIARTAVSATGAAPEAAGANTSEPKVIQLSYGRSSESQYLYAFARRTDSLRFATRHRGRKASAPARRSSVVDTDIEGEEAQRGWKPIANRGGRRVIRLVRKSLDRRGVATVRTRAARDGLLDHHRWRIVLARCSQDPPLYPVDCEIARSGKHFRWSRPGR